VALLYDPETFEAPTLVGIYGSGTDAHITSHLVLAAVVHVGATPFKKPNALLFQIGSG